ncbi:MAG: tRNA uridine-5-carboxymethylaminomethyl(34) synthesis GTPase MnmE [Rhizobium sp.]|nr:tRNA uridine-5-carboxymethylaminomethyl(34) synthesis GTPase MnmE [Rhizobium sp.]
MPTQETIYALSSGGLPSGVAIVRISGPRALEVAADMAGTLPEPRKAALRWLRGRVGEPIDQALVLTFPEPASFTGEDCVEFHVHGGRAVVNALLDELAQHDGMRLAEAGEFSRRAFDNGKLDLVEIEGLADLIAAETEMQRRLAMAQAAGRQSALYSEWAATLTRIRALIEAELDFPDEEDVPGAINDRVWRELAALADGIRHHLHGSASAEIVRDGFRIAIVGPPNAGKSSLLNTLAKRDVAIVTEIAGTTRDVLGIDLDLGGYLVHLMDTAGIRETEDVVEREGVRRALQSIEQADLVLVLTSGPEVGTVLPAGKRVVTVQSKSDLLDASLPRDERRLYLSSVTREGFDSLTKRISDEVAAATGVPGGFGPARRRQADLLRLTLADMEIGLNGDVMSLELRAEALRRAAHSLGKITGRVDVEDLLDVIFSEFCIGK